MKNSSHCGSVVNDGSNTRSITLVCALAILFAFNHIHAQVEHSNADLLLDATDTASEVVASSRWHAAHDDAVVSVHRVRLNTKALELPLPPLE